MGLTLTSQIRTALLRMKTYTASHISELAKATAASPNTRLPEHTNASTKWMLRFQTPLISHYLL